MQINSEPEFQKVLVEKLSGSFGPAYKVLSGANLLYNVVVEPSRGTYHPRLASNRAGLPGDGKRPRYHAFQTDILVLKVGQSPRVVLELKWRTAPQRNSEGEPGGYNTDSIIAYSAKAARHKQIYPYLRYGFVLGNRPTIGRKFFVHSSGFDFAYAMQLDNRKLIDHEVESLRRLVQNQIQSSEELIRLQSGGSATYEFSTEIHCIQRADAAKSHG